VQDVVTHSLATRTPFGPLGSKAVDIFQLDANGEIALHRNLIAAISPTSADRTLEVRAGGQASATSAAVTTASGDTP
jgi:hypothetical protein